MIRDTDITVNFHPSTIPGTRTYGIGTLSFFGAININFTVWPSQFGLGIMVAFPSRQAFKDGQPVLDEKGKNKYYNEVYISNYELRSMIDNAVINAMANKGIVVNPPSSQMQSQHSYQQPRPSYNNNQQSTSFNQVVPQPNNTTVSSGAVNAGAQFNNPTTSSAGPSPGSSITADDDLPF